VSETETVAFKVDSVTPGKPTLQDKNGWLNAEEANGYRQAIEMGDAQVGPSGLAGYSYTKDGKTPDQVVDTAGDFTLGDLPEGETTVQARAVSRAGLASDDAEVTLKVDRTPPTLEVHGAPATEWTNNAVAVRAQATDELSGMTPAAEGEPITSGARISYRVDVGARARRRSQRRDHGRRVRLELPV